MDLDVRLPALPNIPDNLEPELKEFLQALKHWFNVREGAGPGRTLDRFVTGGKLATILGQDADLVELELEKDRR